VNEKLNQYRGSFSQYWQRFTSAQRWMLIGSVVLLALVMFIVILNFAKTEYSLAFTELQPGDAAAIKTYLDSNSIPYQLSPDGTNIGVPTEMVADVRLNVESQGLNQNGSLGYGIFRNSMSGFGTTENEFNVLKVDAIAGEIQQMLNLISGVGGSKVVITMPEQSVFLAEEDQTDASASVIVKIKPGFVLDQAKIDTMYHLVVKSVPGLNYDNISISNQDGDYLAYSKEGQQNGSAATAVAGNLQIKKQFEVDMQKNIKQWLGMMFGQNKVAVTVTSNMNFDQKNTTERLVAPVVDTKGLPVSEEEINKASSSESTEGGTTGTGESEVSNFNTGTSNGNTETEENQRRTNYEINRTENQIVASPFKLRDLSISVALESSETKKMTPDQLTNIQSYLKNIIRTSLADSEQELNDTILADRVTVMESTSFEGKAVIEEPTNITTYLLLGGLALAIVAGGALFFVRRRQAQIAEEEVKSAAAAAAAAAEQQSGKILDIEMATNENQIRRQLEALARRKPEEFVSILRSWILEE